MRVKLAVTFYLVLIATCFAAEPAITIRPVQITSSDKLPESAGEIQPFGFQSDVVQITYLVEGKGLIGIKDKSLQIENVLTKAGKDLIKSDGKSIAEMDPFGAKVSKDGTCILFAISVKKNEFQKTDGLKLKGDVVVLVGSKKETASGTFKPNGKWTIDVGPFKIKKEGDNPKKEGAPAVPGFGLQNDLTKINVKENAQAITEIKLADGDKTLESNGFSSMNGGDDTTYFFEKTGKGPVKITVSYWKDLKEQKLSLDAIKQK